MTEAINKSDLDAIRTLVSAGYNINATTSSTLNISSKVNAIYSAMHNWSAALLPIIRTTT